MPIKLLINITDNDKYFCKVSNNFSFPYVFLVFVLFVKMTYITEQESIIFFGYKNKRVSIYR